MRGEHNRRRVSIVTSLIGALTLGSLGCAYKAASVTQPSGAGGSPGGAGSGTLARLPPRETAAPRVQAHRQGRVELLGTADADAATSAGSGGGGHRPDRWFDRRRGRLKPTNPNLTYTRITIHNRFLAESVAISDFDHDGNLDIAAGRRWYAGPFGPNYNVATGERIYRDGHEDLPTTGAEIEINTGVSDSWAAYSYDINGDGWDDHHPNLPASDMGPDASGQTRWPASSFGTGNWYQNPKNTGTGNWPEVAPDIG